MAVVNIDSDNFEEEVIKSEKKVLIDFYADWCGPCKMIGPVVEELANENADIKVVKVNVDDNSQIAAKYQVMSIPTLIVIENGQVVNQSVGLISKSEILDLIK
jgi:thioredoxin 1